MPYLKREKGAYRKYIFSQSATSCRLCASAGFVVARLNSHIETLPLYGKKIARMHTILGWAGASEGGATMASNVVHCQAFKTDIVFRGQRGLSCGGTAFGLVFHLV